MSWDAKARRVRNVQQQLDAKLAAYSQFASEIAAAKSPLSSSPSVALDMSGGNATATLNQAALESEIQSLLKQYADAQAEQATLLNDPTFPPTPTQLHAVQRHRELLMEIEREFFQTRTQFQHTLSRQQLLGHVQEDIHAYRTQYTSETQAYLDERERLERSQRVMDETLE
ncbi:protein transport protein gos1 [Malassezia yamatoensis]|uniref:Protein transport protein gos1 n=1 Tax=Malassezia yamatoensis TaxID=253288 RepID=A0AAJ5YRB5_9BASI|nr:protein transport protein gos1 [Malassezia yamatoensis]